MITKHMKSENNTKYCAKGGYRNPRKYFEKRYNTRDQAMVVGGGVGVGPQPNLSLTAIVIEKRNA